jgi:hypothetical protein
MNDATKLVAGILLIAITTIEYGGKFLLTILSGRQPGLTEYQRSMFRAGHAHAGVLVILALVSLLYIDRAGLSAPTAWALRAGFAAAPIFVSAGFFGAALGEGRTRPGGLIALLWIGVFVLGGSVLALGVGLIRSRT